MGEFPVRAFAATGNLIKTSMEKITDQLSNLARHTGKLTVGSRENKQDQPSGKRHDRLPNAERSYAGPLTTSKTEHNLPALAAMTGYAISANPFARSRPDVGGGNGFPSW
jgi:hypothetical protein